MDLFKFPHWNSEQDVLVTDARPLLAANHPIVAKTLPWAYAINTAQGFFSMGSKKVVETESIDLQNGKKLEVTSTFQRHTFLCTDNTGELYPFWHSSLSEDVWVWSTDYFDKFLIVTFLKTNQTVLIDSRGIPYELPISGIARYHRADVQIDKKRGCYVIEKTVSVKYRSSLEQAEYDAKTKAEPSTVLNKEFGTFCRRNAKNNQAYLYLTVGQSKCGSFVSYFVEHGMEYEVVPNLFLDDPTLNIRIPLEGNNSSRMDVSFLCSKYFDEYSIYNVPYTEVAGVLEKNKKIEAQCQKMRIFFSNPLDERKETISYYIINTLYNVLGTQDDYEVFKATVSKIMTLLWRTRSRERTTYFSTLLLPHPAEIYDVQRIVDSNREYVERLLSECGYGSWEHLCKLCAERTLDMASEGVVVTRAYQTLYDCSKRTYKQTMKKYEADVIQQIESAGGTVGGWTNEVLLYELVRKVYPEAVFQYHTSWLGNQSIDIFIPNLNVGIEYQGEQHYRPVAVFGGEAGFKALVARDKRKKKLCAENGIRLIYWKYDEAITRAKLDHFLEAESFQE